MVLSMVYQVLDIYLWFIIILFRFVLIQGKIFMFKPLNNLIFWKLVLIWLVNIGITNMTPMDEISIENGNRYLAVIDYTDYPC